MKLLKRQSQENSALRIISAETKHDVKRFIDFQYELYRNDPSFVPPLRIDIKNIISGKGSVLFKKGKFKLFIALKNGKTVGRIAAGIDEQINREKDYKDGYITLFECINDYDTAAALFDTAIAWLKDEGMTLVKGPVSPTGGDDYRGLLVMGFDSPPMLMNSYNYEYYRGFFEKYGFQKRIDLYAYKYVVENAAGANRGKTVAYAMKRYGFRVDSVDFNNIEREIRDIKEILDIAMPEDWSDITPPSLEAIREFATTYKRLADPKLICIARTNDDRPIGFSVALPNYNELFIKMNGRLFPFGFIKLLAGKKNIKSARIFILFVIPEFRKRGVSGAIFYKSFMQSSRRGFTWGEGSTIGDINHSMRRDAEGAGGVHYKTYRVYEKKI
jgi:GNAT superfamily N-acetyltransferase